MHILCKTWKVSLSWSKLSESAGLSSFKITIQTTGLYAYRVTQGLTHRGRVTHICVIKLTIIGSDNGLSPGRRQAIIWTNAGILLIRPLGTNFSEILIEIHTFSFKKMHLKLSSAKLRPFCLGLDVLTWINGYFGKEWGDSSMMFASDIVTQLANRLTRDNKSLFTVRHIFFVYYTLYHVLNWDKPEANRHIWLSLLSSPILALHAFANWCKVHLNRYRNPYILMSSCIILPPRVYGKNENILRLLDICVTNRTKGMVYSISYTIWTQFRCTQVL